MNENLKASEACRALIKKWEGLHDGNPRTSLLEPLADPVGIPTIGWGSTFYEDGKRVTFDDPPITLERAEQMLAHDLVKFENVIKMYVKVELNQNQFDALVSLVYNIGSTNFAGSTLLKKINERCFSCAADQFPRWSHSHGKFLLGLQNRRYDEKLLFLK